MGKRDPRVDAYIANSPEFAKPILSHLRDTVHAACPDVQEDIKWRNPAFIYKGLLCGMASFKHHAACGFWKGALVVDGAAKEMDAAGWFGRLTKPSDLPSQKVLTGYIKKAMALNDQGVAIKRKPKTPAAPLKMPSDFAAALKKTKKAQAAFDAFSPSHRREYIEWIVSAKGDDTRTRRLKQAIEWIAEGKSRNWKYER